MKTDARFERIETQVAVIQNDITGLKHDVTSLFHWDYWLLTFVGAVTQSISAVVSLFNKREITILEVAHNIMFAGTCLCIVSFCSGFRLGCAHLKHKENENITEEKVQAMIDNSIAKAMRDIGTMVSKWHLKNKLAPIPRRQECGYKELKNSTPKRIWSPTWFYSITTYGGIT